MSPEPEAFFAELAARALEGAQAAPSYVSAMPMVGRGWRLTFRLAGGEESVRVNAIRYPDGFVYAYLRAEPGPRAGHLDRVGRLLCRALERVPLEGPLPDPSRAAVAERQEPRQPRGESIGIYLPGDCDRACEFCSVSVQRLQGALPVVRPDVLAEAWASIESRLRERAEDADAITVEWSGKDCLASPLFDRALALAHSLGFRKMGIQSPGTRLADASFVQVLVDHDVDHAALTAHGVDAEVFDSVGGKEGAHRIFWQGVEHLRAAGIRISLEVPCVRNTVDTLPEHLAALVERMGPDTPITIFFWYPSDDMEHTYGERGVDFDTALSSLARLARSVPPRRVAVNGIPECVAPPALREHFFWSYGRQHMSFVDFERIDACDECAARDRCPGVVPSYGRTFELTPRPLGDSPPAAPA